MDNGRHGRLPGVAGWRGGGGEAAATHMNISNSGSPMNMSDMCANIASSSSSSSSLSSAEVSCGGVEVRRWRCACASVLAVVGVDGREGEEREHTARATTREWREQEKSWAEAWTQGAEVAHSARHHEGTREQELGSSSGALVHAHSHLVVGGRDLLEPLVRLSTPPILVRVPDPGDGGCAGAQAQARWRASPMRAGTRAFVLALMSSCPHAAHRVHARTHACMTAPHARAHASRRACTHARASVRTRAPMHTHHTSAKRRKACQGGCGVGGEQ